MELWVFLYCLSRIDALTSDFNLCVLERHDNDIMCSYLLCVNGGIYVYLCFIDFCPPPAISPSFSLKIKKKETFCSFFTYLNEIAFKMYQFW